MVGRARGASTGPSAQAAPVTQRPSRWTPRSYSLPTERWYPPRYEPSRRVRRWSVVESRSTSPTVSRPRQAALDGPRTARKPSMNTYSRIARTSPFPRLCRAGISGETDASRPRPSARGRPGLDDELHPARIARPAGPDLLVSTVPLSSQANPGGRGSRASRLRRRRAAGAPGAVARRSPRAPEAVAT